MWHDPLGFSVRVRFGWVIWRGRRRNSSRNVTLFTKLYTCIRHSKSVWLQKIWVVCVFVSLLPLSPVALALGTFFFYFASPFLLFHLPPTSFSCTRASWSRAQCAQSLTGSPVFRLWWLGFLSHGFQNKNPPESTFERSWNVQSCMSSGQAGRVDIDMYDLQVQTHFPASDWWWPDRKL